MPILRHGPLIYYEIEDNSIHFILEPAHGDGWTVSLSRIPSHSLF
jgi:hypothetical protein